MATIKRHPVPRYVETSAERALLSTTRIIVGTEWFETDTNYIYRWDGIAWRRIGVGPTPLVLVWIGW